jgi:hypothetical protein
MSKSFRACTWGETRHTEVPLHIHAVAPQLDACDRMKSRGALQYKRASRGWGLSAVPSTPARRGAAHPNAGQRSHKLSMTWSQAPKRDADTL